jgi:2-polyprenyl-6-methoxyphenol hydroxylase-like FAD-dependent oxidoreductase
MAIIAKQAVVIGASIAGLAAARALSPYFETVVVIEREEDPRTNNPRKAVPQGNHAHALLKGGELALEQLFPNLIQELIDCDAKQIDMSQDARWYHGGKWKIRYNSGFMLMIQTRPLLELLIRLRVHSLGNVKFYHGYEVESLKTNPDKTKVTGVVIQDMATRSQKIEFVSDLVVEASGRGSKMPQWLNGLGYPAPEETRLKIDLSYSSRLFQAPVGKTVDWKLMVINPQGPKFLRAGYIFPVENNQWLVTFAGYSGEEVPKDNDSFVEYAKGLAQPDIYEHIQDLTPLGDVKFFSNPYMTRRHYEKAVLPDGLLIMGDAFCAFDPVYGQGMTAAAQEAVALAAMLEKFGSLDQIGKRFHQTASQIVETAWLLSSTEDFRYPNTVGKKSPLIPFMHWYSSHLFVLSATDKEVYAAFGKVMHLLSDAGILFKPRIVAKVIKHALAG